MEKPKTINEFAQLLNEQGKSYFREISALMHEAQPEVIETLFVSQPYFYLPKYETQKFHYRPSVMLAFFKDHLNIFAAANEKYEPLLTDYKFTEKHTMQIYFDQPLNREILVSIFKESLHPKEKE
ncbi:MAG TPA: hypothetical protein DEG42_00345 [Acholeplasmataceae bacterium]|nr:MAG: hypothetical protein A2013_04760 [Tenericutes bacterium GWE2_38_8]HBY64849.1 hypothetical protein [Acholeplasmataceae bacterium]HCB67111.1 hypothetical protein [Acholeplasmataceae bacterium]